MARRAQQVVALANEAGLDLDETLVTLWDAGVDVESPSTLLRDQTLAAARTALGLHNLKDQLTVDYWMKKTGLSRESLTESAREVGVKISPNARRIPRNSLKRLRSHFLSTKPTVDIPEKTRLARDDQTDMPAFELKLVGTSKDRIQYLDESEIVQIHEALEEDFRRADDPIFPPGVKSEALVSSSAQKPHTSLGNTLKYPTIEMAGAALFHSLILNHGFHNGNKRTALVSLIAHLRKNGLVLICCEDELFRVTVRVAQHRFAPIPRNCSPFQPDQADREISAIATWIVDNSRSRPSTKGERPTEWRKLRRLLAYQGCEFTTDSGTGNRLNITRAVERKRTVGSGTKTQVLRTQVAWAGDGTEAARNTIRKIRSDLELGPEHNVDSEVFYDRVEPNDLIEEYLHILRRLSVL